MKPPLIVRPLCLYALKDRDREKHFKLTSFRPVTFGSLLVCGFSLLILNCGLDVEDPIPPSPPVWVEKSFPEEWPESGIDAHESGGIYLEWEPNPEGDIVAYKIYRSVFDEIEGVQGEYGILARLDLEGNFNYEYIDIHNEKRKNYWYKITAIDEAGNESSYSDSISYNRLTAIQVATMYPNGRDIELPPDRELRWGYDHTIAMEDYCITVLKEDKKFITREIIVPQNYAGSNDYWQIPQDIIMDSSNVYIWRIDLLANYVNNLESSGSESEWASFIYRED